MIIHNVAIPDDIEQALEYYPRYVVFAENGNFTPWPIQAYISYIEKHHNSYYTLQDYISLMGTMNFCEKFIRPYLSASKSNEMTNQQKVRG